MTVPDARPGTPNGPGVLLDSSRRVPLPRGLPARDDLHGLVPELPGQLRDPAGRSRDRGRVRVRVRQGGDGRRGWPPTACAEDDGTQHEAAVRGADGPVGDRVRHRPAARATRRRQLAVRRHRADRDVQWVLHLDGADLERDRGVARPATDRLEPGPRRASGFPGPARPWTVWRAFAMIG